MINYVELSPTIFTGGSPTPDEIQALRDSGCEVVINLALPDSPNAIPDEAGLVERLKMEYIPIPVVWESPTRENLQDFFAACDRCQGRKMFIHCVKNMRVSAFMYLYRILRQEFDPEEAYLDMAEIWEPDGIWADFIESALAEKPAGLLKED